MCMCPSRQTIEDSKWLFDQTDQTYTRFANSLKESMGTTFKVRQTILFSWLYFNLLESLILT